MPMQPKPRADTSNPPPPSLRFCMIVSSKDLLLRVIESPGGGTMTNVVRLNDEEAVKQVLATSVLGLWEVVNNLTRLRPSRHERYRVAIFGSARAQPGS